MKDVFDKVYCILNLDAEDRINNVTNTFNEYDINNINLSSALQSDFVKCYAMSAENLNKLSEFLWSDNFIDVIKKLQNNPIENIISYLAPLVKK